MLTAPIPRDYSERGGNELKKWTCVARQTYSPLERVCSQDVLCHIERESDYYNLRSRRVHANYFERSRLFLVIEKMDTSKF